MSVDITVLRALLSEIFISFVLSPHMGTLFNQIIRLNMKKILLYAAFSAVFALLAASCTTEKEFNKEFLYGKWHSTTYPGFPGHDFYEVYDSNGTGSSWDETEDGEPQAFKWTLSGETLTRQECMETTGCDVLPYDYTVKELTETTLVYIRAGKTYSWTKN